MEKSNFLRLYWQNYLLLEKEFIETFSYITLDTDNYNVYSLHYIKLLLQIGSEVDVNAKKLCEQYKTNHKLENMGDYMNVITNNESDFCETNIRIIYSCDIPLFTPWESWELGKSPYWWTAYNKVKHERFSTGKIGGVKKEYYKFANMKYTLFALGGFYNLLIYRYYMLNDKKDSPVNTHLHRSHLFQLAGNKWDNVNFYLDMAFYIKNETGELVCETGLY